MVASRRRSKSTTAGAAGAGRAAGGARIWQSCPVVEKVDAILVRGRGEVGPVRLDGGISATNTWELVSNVADKAVNVVLSIS